MPTHDGKIVSTADFRSREKQFWYHMIPIDNRLFTTPVTKNVFCRTGSAEFDGLEQIETRTYGASLGLGTNHG